MPKTKNNDIHAVYADPAVSASEAGLRYLPDTGKGFTRKKEGQSFVYLKANGSRIEDEKVLDRIRKLVIPPAWTDVWICPSANGHIQATGRDVKGRKQYIYHADWHKYRGVNKFSRMIAFGKNLPEIRKKINHDLRSPKLNKRKITAIVVDLLDHSLIRIGNRHYARTNKSYGLTTLRDRHVKFAGDKITFEFVGKKGVMHAIDVHDKKLARLVKKCKDIPGYDLFQYYDEKGNRQTLESGDVNEYLHQICKFEFSAKDFRTWGGTVLMVQCLEEVLAENPALGKEKSIKEAVKKVAKGLGNTPSVCTKYYIHPQVVEMFKDDKLLNFLKKHDAEDTSDGGLSSTEKLVLKMLKSIEKEQKK